MEQQAAKREVSVDEAMSIALLFQKNGQLTEAEDVYCKILSVEPDHPDALHFAGVLAHQLGRSGEAIELIERSLELVPDRADCYSNLGIIFKAQGRVDDAAAAYTRAIALDPSHPNAHSNLGVLLRAQGKLAEAEAAYRKAIELDPEHIDAYHNLGVLLGEPAADAGGRRLLLQGDHAEPAAFVGATAAGAGALHARTAGKGRGDLHELGRRGAGQPDSAAHAGGVFRRGRAGPGIG